jgi:sulfoxide reductase heme-binding subunit YedZ
MRALRSEGPLNRIFAAKVLVVALSLLPLALLVRRALEHQLTANPIEFITHLTGDWALRFLLVTLAVTPIRRVTGWHVLIKFRRTFGLLAFTYATLHMLTYVVLDYFFRFDLMWENLLKTKYVAAGIVAFVLMVPLAATSTRAMMQRLGPRWQRLHRLVYISAIAAVVHYRWLIKVDARVPAAYASILVALFAFRLWNEYHRRRLRPIGSHIAIASN